MCESFSEIGEKFSQMEELDKGGDDPSRGEILGAVGDVMGAAFGFAGNIGVPEAKEPHGGHYAAPEEELPLEQIVLGSVQIGESLL